MKMMGSSGSTSCHAPAGSRLQLRLKQAQLFEAVSGSCPIAFEHAQSTLLGLSTGSDLFFYTGPAMGLDPLDAEFCAV